MSQPISQTINQTIGSLLRPIGTCIVNIDCTNNGCEQYIASTNGIWIPLSILVLGSPKCQLTGSTVWRADLIKVTHWNKVSKDTP